MIYPNNDDFQFQDEAWASSNLDGHDSQYEQDITGLISSRTLELMQILITSDEPASLGQRALIREAVNLADPLERDLYLALELRWTAESESYIADSLFPLYGTPPDSGLGSWSEGLAGSVDASQETESIEELLKEDALREAVISVVDSLSRFQRLMENDSVNFQRNAEIVNNYFRAAGLPCIPS